MLKNKVVVITGAGAGVGKGIALACAKAGAKVVIAARRLDNGERVAAAIREMGGDAIAIQCDVSMQADVEKMIAQTIQHYGVLDALVHNATSGASPVPNKIEEIDDALWYEHSSVSLQGSFYCAKAAYQQLKQQQGKLILLTSPAGMEGSENLPLYSMVKAGQRGFAKSLAQEWGADNINVNCISPLAKTDALVRAFDANPALEAKLSALTALARIGDPEKDIGAAAVLLLSQSADYITGQTWVVDGGRFMGL